MKAVALGLVLLALVTFVPLWLPLVLAAWIAHLARPVANRIEGALGGRKQIAGAFTLLLILLVFVPLGAALFSLAGGAAQLASSVSKSPEWSAALQSLVTDRSPGEAALMSPAAIVQILKEHGATAWQVLGRFAGAATEALIGLFVFASAIYAFLVDGPRMWAWLRRYSPLANEHTARLTAAFYETGRGLIIGMGGTALAQGLLSTVAYLALGVPRAFVLGFLTFVGAFIPTVGTALVWVPVAAGLALTGHYVEAIILALLGTLVISTIDNVLRPVLSRWGKLKLPVVVQLISIFGAFTVFGPSGLVLGPLAVRLASEALAIAREENMTGERAKGE